MKDVVLTSNTLDPNGYWTVPLADSFAPKIYHLELFDQNGYDLTELEKLFAESNNIKTGLHRTHRTAIKRPWFDQADRVEGTILNHSLLFERKGFQGDALAQLKMWTKYFPRIWQLIQLRPKWGLDFSMDYADVFGNCFEILHWEYDGFAYEEINHVKQQVEPVLLSIDWYNAAQQLLKKKDEWYHLDFFAQSDYKCKYFGIVRERFKMVAWQ
jgi:hypothetical protein